MRPKTVPYYKILSSETWNQAVLIEMKKYKHILFFRYYSVCISVSYLKWMMISIKIKKIYMWYIFKFNFLYGFQFLTLQISVQRVFSLQFYTTKIHEAYQFRINIPILKVIRQFFLVWKGCLFQCNSLCWLNENI